MLVLRFYGRVQGFYLAGHVTYAPSVDNVTTYLATLWKKVYIINQERFVVAACGRQVASIPHGGVRGFRTPRF